MQKAIIIDTRERTPFSFPGYRVKRSGLSVGDYSVQGHEDRLAIERKSGPDLINTLLVNKERFEKELERGQEFEMLAIVVECSMASLLLSMRGKTSVPLRVILSRLGIVCSKHRVPFFFCDNRALAESMTLELLRPWLTMPTPKARRA